MASVDIFNSTTSSVDTSDDSVSPFDETIAEAPLTLSINDIKMFESLELETSGNSELIIEGSLEETDSMLEDSTQNCKICK